MTSAGAVADDVSGWRQHMRWRWRGRWRHLGLMSAEEPWRVQARGGSWRRVGYIGDAWRRVPVTSRLLVARGRSNEDEISQKGRSERFLSHSVICGLIREAEAVVAARQWSLMYWSHDGGSGAAHSNGCRWHPRRQDCLRAAHQRIRAVALIPC